MGYSTILDIVGSIIIGGVLIVILLTTNSSAVQNSFNYGGDLTIQQYLKTVVDMVDQDFSKIGYTSIATVAIDPTKRIVLADTSSITFISDIDNNGSIETVYYYLGTTNELAGTINPRDRILYRVSKDTSGSLITSRYPGITIFRLLYTDKNGATLSSPVASTSNISKIQIYLTMESSVPYNGVYVGTNWSSTKCVTVNVDKR
jgi:hypothetical protein